MPTLVVFEEFSCYLWHHASRDLADWVKHRQVSIGTLDRFVGDGCNLALQQ